MEYTNYCETLMYWTKRTIHCVMYKITRHKITEKYIKRRLIYLDKVNAKNFSSRKDISKYLENQIKKVYASSLSKKLTK